jgi:uncharacterized protein involved in exopolysaccharide biosynthesis
MNRQSEREVVAVDFLAFLARRGWVLLLCAAVGVGAALALAAWTPKQYRADVVLLPVKADTTAGGLSSQIGGLAALAGLSLGAGGDESESLEVLKSRSLCNRFLEKYDVVPALFPKRWDAAGKKWIGQQPSVSEAVARFDARVKIVSQDKVAGTVRLSMRWTDPAVAARWANDFAALANEEIRQRAEADARRMIAYLNKELATNNVLEVREAINRLIESQLKNQAMANVRNDFAFKVLDPALVPDANDFVSPIKLAYAALGSLLGLALGLAVGAGLDRRLARRLGP